MVSRIDANSVMDGSSPNIVTVSPTFASTPVISSIDISIHMLPIVGTLLVEIENLAVSFSEFSDALAECGKKRNLEIRVMHEDIFNSMHKI